MLGRVEDKRYYFSKVVKDLLGCSIGENESVQG